MKRTPEGQRYLAAEARRMAEAVRARNEATARFFERVAAAHEAEAKRIEVTA